MKYASPKYSTDNVGDWIQSIAAEQFLPKIDTYIDRDRTNQFSSVEKYIMIMNGWYSHKPENWPPSPSILPIFTSVHLTPKTAAAYSKHKDYFKKFGPIGCRDQGTLEYFKNWSVPSYLSYCLTLTFPRHAKIPKNGKVAIVDAAHLRIPRSLKKNSMTFQHTTVKVASNATNQRLARELLEFYRNEVRLVITTKIHCAMPCMAMGIPVVYFGDKRDSRVSVISDIGGIIYNQALHRKKSFLHGRLGSFLEHVDWSPDAIDLGQIPQKLQQDIKHRLEGAETLLQTF